MPSNWLYIDTNFPTFTGEESPNDKISTIQNYLFMLVEQLRYTLHNLDTANMNLTALEQYSKGLTDPIYIQIGDLSANAEGIIGRMEDAEGNITLLQQSSQAIASWAVGVNGDISVLQQTAQAITVQVQNAQGDISTLQQTATSITARVEQVNTDLTGKIQANASEIQQTAQTITAQVSRVETDLSGRIAANTSSIEQTATSITARVEEVNTDLSGKIEANASEFRQTAGEITATVLSTQGDVSVLQQTAASLTSRVSNAEGSISELKQTAASLTSRIANTEGNVSKLEQTAEGIKTRVTNAEGDLSELEQRVDGFKLEVTNGDTASTIVLKSGSATVSSQKIQMNGLVTFTGLSKGTTTIDGACIKTGIIGAKYIDADVIRTGDLKDGATVISGSNILTGKIKADYIDVDNLKVKKIYGPTNLVLDASQSGRLYIGSAAGVTLGTMKLHATEVTIGAGEMDAVKVDGSSLIPMKSNLNLATVGDSAHVWGAGYFASLHGNTAGMRILGATEKLGFFGVTPVAKKTVSGSTDTARINSLITALRSYGLIG